MLRTPQYQLYSTNLSDLAATPGGGFLASLDYQSFTAAEGVPADFVRFTADGQPNTTFGQGTRAADSFFKDVRRIAVRADGYFYALGSDQANQLTVSNEVNW